MVLFSEMEEELLSLSVGFWDEMAGFLDAFIPMRWVRRRRASPEIPISSNARDSNARFPSELQFRIPWAPSWVVDSCVWPSGYSLSCRTAIESAAAAAPQCIAQHIMVRFGRWEEILADDTTQYDPVKHVVAHTTRTYARGIAFGVRGQVSPVSHPLWFLGSAFSLYVQHARGVFVCTTTCRLPPKG